MGAVGPAVGRARLDLEVYTIRVPKKREMGEVTRRTDSAEECRFSWLKD